MNENENYDSIDHGQEENGGQSVSQDGEYGWQSVVPQRTAEDRAPESRTAEDRAPESRTAEDRVTESRTAEDRAPENRTAEGRAMGDRSESTSGRQTAEPNYTRTGAYAEASSKELSRAAREARRQEKQRKKAAKKSGGRFWGKVAAVLMSGILFGCATAGAFIGVIHLTGYADRMEKTIDAVAQMEEIAKKQNEQISNGTAVNAGVEQAETDVQAVYEKALPSVVAITNTAVYRYNFGFYSYDDEVQGSGSGIIIGKNETELLIVTNYHVIENAKSLAVTFVDGKTVEAYVKGTAEDNDLAVVAVMLNDIEASTKSEIAIATLGAENKVAVGQKVAAIGNALGYGQVLTVGYISAVDRQVTIEGKEMTLIQTDAAINPGNSGGALLNMNGEVIGINSAKYSDTKVEGMGFAIPISLVKEIIEDLMTRETLMKVSEDEMGYIGIGVETSSGNAYSLPSGAYIVSIGENTPAAESDLRLRDIVTAVDDISVQSREDLLNALSYYKGGSTVTLTVQRLIDGEFSELKIDVTLGYRRDYVEQ